MKKNTFRNTMFWYNFILCIFVIFIHAKNDAQPAEVLIVRLIADTGVAGFFLCSGYLFYKNYSYENMLQKYRSRITSVLVPYVLWNLLYYLFNIILCQIPKLRSLFPDKNASFSLSGIIDAIINYTWCPIFWYLQFLIIFILLSPVCYLLIKNKYIGVLTLSVLLLIIATGNTIIANDMITSLGNWLFIYLSGAYLGIHFRTYVEEKEMRLPWLAASCTCTLILSYFYTNVPSIFCNLLYFFSFVTSLWCVLRKLPLPEAKDWQKNTFMVYITHFLVVRTLNTVFGAVSADNSLLSLLLFFLMPVICFTLVHLAKLLCMKLCPAIWNVLSGSR